MYYEINISKHKKHFFATAKRSLTTLQQTKIVYRELRKAFPDDDGYEVTITKWCVCGAEILTSEL